MMPRFHAVLLAAVLPMATLPTSPAAVAAPRAPAPPEAQAPRTAESRAAAPQRSLAARLDDGWTRDGTPLISPAALRLFYEARGNRLAWSDGGKLSPQAGDLLAAIRSVDREGLRPADYHLAAIERLRDRASKGKRPAPTTDADLVDLDVLLSDAFFLYARHLTSGRVNPTAIEPEWNIAGRDAALPLLLAAALGRGHLAGTLAELPPARDDYRRLRAALAAQRAVAAAGGWPLVAPGPTLREGDRGPRIAALRRRLAATGDLPENGPGDQVCDRQLAQALRRFQARHGLDADAIAGGRTLAALNVPASLRARQIEANLERLRWLPRDLAPRRLVVNIPDFRLTLTEPGAPDLSMRVIAGRQSRRTPFFTGEITSVLVNPPWVVPAKIALEDKLPLILGNRDFFAEERFRLFARAGMAWREIDPRTVDWKRLPASRFPYRLRQDPGPRNALGRLKFQIPNRYDIYLHDTPSRGLFARPDRAYSSGCIRVERAAELAARLLSPDPAWTRAKIEAAIAAGATLSVPLREPMPVYLLYQTTWVDPDGTVEFREDVYGRDAALLEALAGAPAPR
ncbi:MAG TPA: L,D-transpeptidase family protein [bacterium]